MWCDCDTSNIVLIHIQCQASIYTLSLCTGYSWRVRLAKQETLTPPGHLVSPLVCRGPWMSTVLLYCLCHSDSASVLLYFTLITFKNILYMSKYLKYKGHVNIQDWKWIMISKNISNLKKVVVSLRRIIQYLSVLFVAKLKNILFKIQYV